MIGIDLGTTNSAIAMVNEFGKPEIIPNKEGERITPSVVLFDGNEIVVGTIAKQSSVADPENTVSFIKPLMGSTDFMFDKNGIEYTPEDISAMILRKLINDAEEYLDEKITDVVITVPAYFNDKQRKATIDAGKIAGVNILQIINEPTAAALTYGLDKEKEQTIMVYDLGGGTFDVTIMDLKSETFNVIASDGDRLLGGKNFDEKLMIYLNDKFKEQCQIDLFDDPILQQDLRLKAENAKIALSSKQKTTIYISAQGKSAKIEITRKIFSDLVADFVTRTELLLDSVMSDAGFTWDDIDQILLVGGATRMPVISEMIKKISGKEPSLNINPDEAVSLGAAIQAGIITAKDNKSEIAEMVRMKYKTIKVGDVTSHSFGAIILDEVNNKRNAIIIPKNNKIPIRKSKIFYTTISSQTSVKLTVIQGEDPDPEFCTVIGTTTLEFPPKEINSPIIFNYEYDVSGIIHATAKDPETGKKSVIKIAREGELSGDEVRMKTEQLNEIYPKRREYIKKDSFEDDEILQKENSEISEIDEQTKKATRMLSDVFEFSEDLDISLDKKEETKEEIQEFVIPEKTTKPESKPAAEPITERKKEILKSVMDKTIKEQNKAVPQDRIKKPTMVSAIEEVTEDQEIQEARKKKNDLQEETLIDRNTVLTDDSFDSLIKKSTLKETKLDINVAPLNSENLENAVDSLESEDHGEWDKILKLVQLEDSEEEISKAELEKESLAPLKSESYIELESNLSDSTEETDKNTEIKDNKKKESSSSKFLDTNETIMDWISEAEEDDD